MKKICLEIPNDTECLVLTYFQSICKGNIGVGQRIVVNNDLRDGNTIVIKPEEYRDD